MLTLGKLETTIVGKIKESAEESGFDPNDILEALKFLKNQALAGVPFDEARKYIGLYPREELCQLINQYYDLFSAESRGEVAARSYAIALMADFKEATPMLKHITSTQMGWSQTSKHELKDTTGMDEFTLDRDDS